VRPSRHRCTFEVLLGRLGIGHLIAGIAMAHREDEERLARGAAVLDDLYEYLRRKRA
jgi:hypothetical protein